jgi:hypothetical protein
MASVRPFMVHVFRELGLDEAAQWTTVTEHWYSHNVQLWPRPEPVQSFSNPCFSTFSSHISRCNKCLLSQMFPNLNSVYKMTLIS